MNNVEALKQLYVALGGSETDVANAVTSVEVLNAIAAKYDGVDNATLNPEGILNVAAIVDKIGGDSTELRHIVINTFEQDGTDDPIETGVQATRVGKYDTNGVYQMGALSFSGEYEDYGINAYYPTIDNKNIIKFDVTIDPNQSFSVEAPEGVAVEESAGQYEETVYTLTIGEDISEPIKLTWKYNQ